MVNLCAFAKRIVFFVNHVKNKHTMPFDQIIIQKYASHKVKCPAIKFIVNCYKNLNISSVKMCTKK